MNPHLCSQACLPFQSTLNLLTDKIPVFQLSPFGMCHFAFQLLFLLLFMHYKNNEIELDTFIPLQKNFLNDYSYLESVCPFKAFLKGGNYLSTRCLSKATRLVKFDKVTYISAVYDQFSKFSLNFRIKHNVLNIEGQLKRSTSNPCYTKPDSLILYV